MSRLVARFLYVNSPREPHKFAFPICTVLLRSPANPRQLYGASAILDTGSDLTIMRPGFDDVLQRHLGRVGRLIDPDYHRDDALFIELSFNGTDWQTPVHAGTAMPLPIKIDQPYYDTYYPLHCDLIIGRDVLGQFVLSFNNPPGVFQLAM